MGKVKAIIGLFKIKKEVQALYKIILICFNRVKIFIKIIIIFTRPIYISVKKRKREEKRRVKEVKKERRKKKKKREKYQGRF